MRELSRYLVMKSGDVWYLVGPCGEKWYWTQAEAIRLGEKQSRKNRPARLSVQGKTGEIRWVKNYPRV